jgi:imidazolonepropionase-like amidohydrolase
VGVPVLPVQSFRRESELGTLESGKIADLIIVDGNSLEDLQALKNVEVVVKGGKVVMDNRTGN